LVHYVFFFSSRRRHTRSKRDWSSDVCSSDLGPDHRIEMDSTETFYHPGSQADFSKPSALQLRDAAIEYPASGRKKAFRAAHHINLMIAPGEVVGLVGEAGSGKTTIGRAALGLLPTVEGDIVVNGTSIKGL